MQNWHGVFHDDTWLFPNGFKWDTYYAMLFIKHGSFLVIFIKQKEHNSIKMII